MPTKESKKRRPYGTGPYAKKKQGLAGLQDVPRLKRGSSEKNKSTELPTFIFLKEKDVVTANIVKQRLKIDPTTYFKQLPIGDLKPKESLFIPQIDQNTMLEHAFFNTTKLNQYIDKYNKLVNSAAEFNICTYINEEQNGDRTPGRLITRAK